MEFALTARLREAAKGAPPHLRIDARATTIGLQHAADLSTLANAKLRHLLHGARPVRPSFGPSKREPHPSLAPRLEQLKNEQVSREYAAMVGDVVSADAARDFAEMRTFRSQMAVGANLVISMGTMFCVGYWGGGTDDEPHGPRAVLCGAALMILTMLIEVTLFLIGASRTEQKIARREEKARQGAYDLTRIRDLYPDEAKSRAHLRSSRLTDWRGLSDL